MPEENMSISINNSTVTGQLGQAGRDLIQNQGRAGQVIASADIFSYLVQIEELIQNSNLLDTQKSAAIRHIDIAREEVQRKEPEKKFAAINLQRVVEVLKSADQTAGAGQGLFEKVKPIIEKLLPWLGVAKGFFGF